MSGNRKLSVSQVTIEGLDDVLQEKLHPKQNILLLGSPFSGKTTFAIQFLVSGLKTGERAIFVTTSDTPEGIRNQAHNFGWDLLRYEKQGKMVFVDCYSRIIGLSQEDSPTVLRSGISGEHLSKVSLMISAVISDFWREGKRIRLVFDNLSTLFYYNDLSAIARFLHTLLGRLKAVGATSMLILESGVHDEQTTTVLRSLCDGVLQLSGDGEKRYIQGILGVGSLPRLPVEIDERGLRVAKAPTNRIA